MASEFFQHAKHNMDRWMHVRDRVAERIKSVYTNAAVYILASSTPGIAVSPSGFELLVTFDTSYHLETNVWIDIASLLQPIGFAVIDQFSNDVYGVPRMTFIDSVSRALVSLKIHQSAANRTSASTENNADIDSAVTSTLLRMKSYNKLLHVYTMSLTAIHLLQSGLPTVPKTQRMSDTLSENVTSRQETKYSSASTTGAPFGGHRSGNKFQFARNATPATDATARKPFIFSATLQNPFEPKNASSCSKSSRKASDSSSILQPDNGI